MSIAIKMSLLASLHYDMGHVYSRRRRDRLCVGHPMGLHLNATDRQAILLLRGQDCSLRQRVDVLKIGEVDLFVVNVDMIYPASTANV